MKEKWRYNKIIEALKLLSYKCKKRKRLFIYYAEKKYNVFLNHIFIIEIVIINDFFFFKKWFLFYLSPYETTNNIVDKFSK